MTDDEDARALWDAQQRALWDEFKELPSGGPPEMTHEEDMKAKWAEFNAEEERFQRRQRRRARIALWTLIPYLIGVALLTGAMLITYDVGLHGTAGLIGLGFLALVGLQWIVPEVTRRSDRKD